ncbi:cilium assembly protein DZIP1L [Vulpes vulpes]|uniref:Cilium assembly protein DZIP1L n=1 Tax=Vulpes vulpes TaxID=9627 RepID=A0ABM4XYD3_VULVU
MQYLVTTAEGLNGSVLGAYPVPPFKFHLRSESVDWRRLSAVDVDRVVRELDVATLQDNIIHVTFCSLDQEVCHRCRQPLDQAMLNLVRLAQLTIEYLLHCQNCLSTTITQLETRLQASLSQQEKDRQELERQAQEFKGVKEESRQRRKMIHTLQQLLLQTGGHNYHPCHLCDKAFMNVTFLQSHIQRKHLNMAEGAKQKKPEWLLEEDMLEELRDKLKQTQEELEAQREAEKRRQLQEAEVSHQKEIETKKKFDEWKEKERASLYEEIDKFKKSLWDEFKSVTNHNSMLEEKLQMLQFQSQSMMESNLKLLLDESQVNVKQSQEIQALKEKMDIQIRTMSLRKEEGTCKGLKAVEPEDSSSEDLKNSRGDQQKVLASLRPKPTLLKFRSMVEKTLEKKLESMGIPKNKKGISIKTLQYLEPLLRYQRLQKTQECSEFLSLRVKFDKEVTSRAKKIQKKERTLRFQLDTKAPVQRQRGPKVIKEAQPKPKAKTLPVALPFSVAEVPMEIRQRLKGHGPGLARVPAPIPHQRAHGHFDSPASLRRGLSTSPFSLEEDSEQQTLLQPKQGPFRKRPQSRADRECSDIETLEESLQPPDKSSGGLASSVQRQRGPKVIKEAQPKPKAKDLPVALPSSVAEVPMETRQSLKGHGPGLARVPAPIPHQRAHGHFDSPASLRRGLSKSPFSLEEDSEQQTLLQPKQGPFRKRPQSRADRECSDIETLEESSQPPDKSSVQRQRGPKVIKEAQPKPKAKDLPVALPSSVAEVPMETRQSLKGHGPGLARVPAPIPHQRAHGHFDSPASLRRGLSKSPFSLEEDSEQQTLLQPKQGPFRKRPQSRADRECSDIETLEESSQPPDKSSVQRQRGPKVIKEAQAKPKPRTLPVALPSSVAEVPMETRQSLKGHGPGLARVPAPIPHQRAHGHFDSPASLRRGLSKSPFSLEEDSEQQTLLQPKQGPFRKRPQSRADRECSDIETLEESSQPPDKSSVQRQRGPKVIKEAQPKPKAKDLPVALPSSVAEVPMETHQSLKGHGPGLARVPAPIPHQRAHGHFDSPASLRRGLSKSPFSLEEDSEQQTLLQPKQGPFRKRPQSRADRECSDIETLEESSQPPDKSSVQRQWGPKVIKEAQAKPKPRTLPVALPSSVAEVPMETRQSLKGHGPGLARVPAPIPHQRAHGHFDSPASLRRGLSKSPFSLEEDAEQQTFLQPLQDPFRPQSRADWECSDIETLEEIPQPPEKSSVQRQRGPKVIKEAQPKPKPRTLPVALPCSVVEVPMETHQSLNGHGPGLAQVPAPIPHQRAHGHLDSPASLRRGLSKSPFSLEEDTEQQIFHQPLQDPFRPQSLADLEFSDIETLEEIPQPPGKSSETMVQSLVKNFEEELDVPVQKPHGGIKLFLPSKGGPRRAAVPGSESQVSCLG